MNKRIRLVVMFSLTLLLAFSLVTADKDHINQLNRQNNSHHHDTNNSSNNTRLNYGLCVSNYSHIQQDCFTQAKDNQTKCINLSITNLLENLSNTLNQSNSTTNYSNLSKNEQKRLLRQYRSQIIDLVHECRDQYKQEKDQCKEDFKSSKLQCVQFRCKSSQTFSNETNKCVEKEKAHLGELCGGIQGIMCEKGLKCQYISNNPDATGTCVSKSSTENNTQNSTQ